MEVSWNPWHGCDKTSPGCKNCYVYRRDAKYELDSRQAKKNKSFSMPIDRYKNGEYKVKSGTLFDTCFTSDFFLDKADEWRKDAWKIIKERSDCSFFFITKRIDRFYTSLPNDWGDGYDHVAIGLTVENQDRVDYRMPIFMSLPIKHKLVICAPLLEKLDLSKYLTKDIECVSVGGESGGRCARICDYDWVLDIREQCKKAGVNFSYHQTGSKLKKDGKLYIIERKLQHSQARKANIELK